MSTLEERLNELELAHAVLQQEVRELRAQSRPEGHASARHPLSRRGLLLGTGAVVGVAAVGALGLAPNSALASNGQPVIAGENTTDTASTSVVGSVLSGPALLASNYFSGTYDNYADAFQAYVFGAGLAAIYGRNDASGGASLMGYSGGGTALYAAGGGRLRQDANLSAGPPTYTPNTFEQVRDGKGVLWLSDSTNAWRRINTLIPVSPTRVLDTRNGTGGVSGAQGNGATLTLAIAGSSGIPSTAVGMIGNLTAVGPTAAGYLTIYPAGITVPGTSNVNFTAPPEPNYNLANQVTVGFGTGSSAGDVSIYVDIPGGAVNVLLDVFAYIQ